MFENNDPAMRQLTMDVTLAYKGRLTTADWTGTWQLDTDIPFYDLQREDAAPLEVIIRFELPAPIRVEAAHRRVRPEPSRRARHGRLRAIRLPRPSTPRPARTSPFLVVTAPPLSPERA